MLGLIGEGTGIAAKVLKSMGASPLPPPTSPRAVPLPYPTPSLFPREKYIKKDAREPLALERAAAKRANRRSDR